MFSPGEQHANLHRSRSGTGWYILFPLLASPFPFKSLSKRIILNDRPVLAWE
jgi:hypothetical protein